MKKQDAIELMNRLGADREPFVFWIDYKMQRPSVYRISDIPDNVRFDFKGFSKKTHTVYNDKNNVPEVKLIAPHSFELYNEQFAKVKHHLAYGNSYLLNLTAKSEIQLNASLNEIFKQSNAPYKLLVEDEFVVFSPEQFIHIENEVISTYPMKGTIDASEENAENKLLSSVKEKEEHATIVDLLRNDISKVANQVKVKEYRYVDRIETSKNELLQVSSSIEGKIFENYISQFGSILFSLLPAGSICGAPKPKTLEIIDEVENYDRGYYTGVMGYYDGKVFDSAVMIRYIEQHKTKFFYKSGGGITHKSECKQEYNELIQKIYVPITGDNKSS